jgi:hypothetical protein
MAKATSDYGYGWSWDLTDAECQARYTHPVYAVCNAGKGRWFWLAEAHHWFLRPADDGHKAFEARWPELGSGYATDRDTALALAREAAGPDALQEEPRYASHIHRQRAKARNMDRALARNQDATGATQPEYVYTLEGGQSFDDWLQWSPYTAQPHAILRKTARYVFVAGRYRESPALRLNREQLEQTGMHSHPRLWRSVFFLNPPDVAAMNAEYDRHKRQPGATVLAALKALNLDAGAAALDIERAYRRHAFDAHPDRGGDPDRFIIVRAAYETAIAAAKAGAA